jgi:DNA-binding MarR family transcriptional regulator
MQRYDSAVTTPDPDLGASLHRLTRAVIDRELPILGAHDLEMWDYVVLSALHDRPSPTQAQLAETVGRDATRLIRTLDGLQTRGLVERRPAPHDRRNRVVTLTAEGRHVLTSCRTAIRAMEAELLADLEPAARTAFLSALHDLSARFGRPGPTRP